MRYLPELSVTYYPVNGDWTIPVIVERRKAIHTEEEAAQLCKDNRETIELYEALYEGKRIEMEKRNKKNKS
jgi:hypothetical protein